MNQLICYEHVYYYRLHRTVEQTKVGAQNKLDRVVLIGLKLE